MLHFHKFHKTRWLSREEKLSAALTDGYEHGKAWSDAGGEISRCRLRHKDFVAEVLMVLLICHCRQRWWHVLLLPELFTSHALWSESEGPPSPSDLLQQSAARPKEALVHCRDKVHQRQLMQFGIMSLRGWGTCEEKGCCWLPLSTHANLNLCTFFSQARRCVLWADSQEKELPGHCWLVSSATSLGTCLPFPSYWSHGIQERGNVAA